MILGLSHCVVVLDTKSASVMTMVELKSEQDWLTLPLNKWGFKEPPLENLENRDSLEDVVISDPGENILVFTISEFLYMNCTHHDLQILYRVAK